MGAIFGRTKPAKIYWQFCFWNSSKNNALFGLVFIMTIVFGLYEGGFLDPCFLGGAGGILEDVTT